MNLCHNLNFLTMSNSTLHIRDQNKCPICFDIIEYDTVLVVGECKHAICFNCGLEFYINYSNRLCPYCRNSSISLYVTTNEEIENSQHRYVANYWLSHIWNIRTNHLYLLEKFIFEDFQNSIW